MRYIAKELIQLADALLDVADLALSLHYQRLLKVYFVLGCEAQLLLLLLLLLLLTAVL